MTEEEKPKRPKVVRLDDMPEALYEKRDEIRAMMRQRCALPDSPIPPKMAMRAADWIMMLVAMRAYWRTKKGKKPFPDKETLQNDIARSAESVETVIVVMMEEAEETLDGIPQILRV